jgi:hypothetical protein
MIEDNTCMECGMLVDPKHPYHPYAACLMFKACHNSKTVQANLDAVVAYGYQMACEEGNWGTIAPISGQVRLP